MVGYHPCDGGQTSSKLIFSNLTSVGEQPARSCLALPHFIFTRDYGFEHLLSPIFLEQIEHFDFDKFQRFLTANFALIAALWTTVACLTSRNKLN